MPNLDYFIEIHPNHEPTHFILEILEDLRYVSHNGMDTTALSFTEIKAYLDLMQIRLSPFYISLISRLSVTYLHYMKTDKEEPHPVTGKQMGGMSRERLDKIRSL